MDTILKKSKIKTSRLVLKPYTPEDRPALMGLLQNKEITETFMVPSYETVAEYEALADKLIRFSQTEDTVHLEYGIYLEEELIGFLNDCGYDDSTIEVGYVIHPAHRGNGYAAEALGAVLEELRESIRKVPDCMEPGIYKDSMAPLIEKDRHSLWEKPA